MPRSYHHDDSFPSDNPWIKFEKHLKSRNFSRKTVKSYLYYNKEFLRFANKFADDINKQDIIDYFDYLFSSGRSESTVNLALSSLKYYYNNILSRNFFEGKLGIKRPKKANKIPTVLSKQEIVRMIEACGNVKHKLVIQVMYSSGLRVSELRDLEIGQIDFERKTVFVSGGKGKKDRITVISETVLENIQKYLLAYQPEKYLFENSLQQRKMSVRSLQKVVSDSARRARIKKTVSAHTLRHSFATHQLENGVNLRYIQSMLGHARLETTQIYTKVATNKLEEIEDLI